MKKTVFPILFLFLLIPCFCFAESVAVTVSVTAQNTWTGPLYAKSGNQGGFMNVSISGTWAGTVTLQRRFGTTGTWTNYETFTSNYEGYFYESEGGVQYRIGIATGQFTSGTAVLRLSKEK
jgi:hypothetical protein